MLRPVSSMSASMMNVRARVKSGAHRNRAREHQGPVMAAQHRAVTKDVASDAVDLLEDPRTPRDDHAHLEADAPFERTAERGAEKKHRAGARDLERHELLPPPARIAVCDLRLRDAEAAHLVLRHVY